MTALTRDFVDNLLVDIKSVWKRLSDPSRPIVGKPSITLADADVGPAITALVDIASDHPDRLIVLYAAALIWVQNEPQKREPYELLARLLSECPGGSIERREVARLCALAFQSVDFAFARSAALELITFEPNNADAYAKAADMAAKLGDWADAARLVDQGTAAGWRGLHCQMDRPLAAAGPVRLALSQARRDCFSAGRSADAPPADIGHGVEAFGDGAPDILDTDAECGGDGIAGVRARIGGTESPTEYRFEYGTDPEDLSGTTPWRWLPPPLSGSMTEHAVHAADRFSFYALGGLDAVPPDDDRPLGCVALQAPFGKDRNHLSGIGVADLVLAWWPAAQAENRQRPPNGCRGLDIRGATVELTYRPLGVDAKRFKFYVASTTRHTGYTPGGDEINAPWVVTGHPLDVSGDGWRTARITLSGDLRDWSFAGNNPYEQPDFERYRYQDLEASLRENRGNLVFWFLFGDARDTPSGTIEVESIRLAFRDASILAPHAGARLTACPAAAEGDAHFVTDGRTGEPDRCWSSASGEPGPHVFQWELADTVTPDEAHFHQHPAWPTRRASVAVSTDGSAFETLWAGDLDPCDLDGGSGSGDVRIVRFAEPRPARHVRLCLESGHGTGRWGLDGFRMFAEDHVPRPGTEPCPVGDEIAGLAPGALVHVRAVARTQDRTVAGPVVSVRMPDDARPRLDSVTVERRTDADTVLNLRVSAMGQESLLDATFSSGPDRTHEAARLSIGREAPARTALLVVPFGHDVDFECVVGIENAAGRTQAVVRVAGGTATHDGG